MLFVRDGGQIEKQEKSKLVFSFYQVGTRDHIKVVRLAFAY